MPVDRLKIVDATVVGMGFVPLVIAPGRLGFLRIGLERFGLRWPTLGGTTLGVVGSFHVYPRRSTLLNATFMWVAYGTVRLSRHVEPFPWFPVASGIAVASTVAFELGGVAVPLAVVDIPSIVESGFYRYPTVLGLALLLVVLAGRPLLSRLRERVDRSSPAAAGAANRRGSGRYARTRTGRERFSGCERFSSGSRAR